jgi:hypothetical protein
MQNSVKNGTSNKTRIGRILFRTFSAFSGQFRLFNWIRTSHIAGNYVVQEQVVCSNPPKIGTANTMSIRWIFFCIFSAFPRQLRLFNLLQSGHIAGNYVVQEQVVCSNPPKIGTTNTMSIRWIFFCIFSAFPGQLRLFNLLQSGHIAGNYDVQEQVACRTLPKMVLPIKRA